MLNQMVVEVVKPFNNKCKALFAWLTKCFLIDKKLPDLANKVSSYRCKNHCRSVEHEGNFIFKRKHHTSHDP